MGFIISGLFRILFWLPLWLTRELRRSFAYRRGVVLLRINKKNVKSFDLGEKGLEQLDRFAADPDLRVFAVIISELPSGWASLEAIRQRLLKMKEKNKKVLIHLQTPLRKGLYIGSAADSLWILPAGNLLLPGVGQHFSFYGGLFAKLGMKADIEAAGDFKSAGEPYSRQFPSSPNREQLGSLLSGLQNELVSSIASGREVSEEMVLDAMASSPLSPEQALDFGLIDGGLHEDEFIEKLKETVQSDSNPLSISFYDRLLRWEAAMTRWGEFKQKIVVLHLKGAIVDQKSGSQKIDAEGLVETLNQLADDTSIKAVVLAVDSPGGSAVASDRIGRAVSLLGRKKPVIASFGNVAASGGYYISAYAQEIIAQPTSITGSIGVIGGKLVLGPAMEKTGVRAELISAGPDADYFSSWSSFTDDQRRRFRLFLEQTYRRFVQVVSGGRKLPEEAVEAVAGGRVWTGKQAHDHGLVDDLGGLELAVEKARLRANIQASNVRVVHVREEQPWYKKMLPMPVMQAQGLIQLALLDSPALFQLLWNDPMTDLMLMPWSFNEDDFSGSV